MEMKTIVTGATGAIGAAAAESLVSEGRPVIMACRNLEKAEAVRQDILGRVPSAQLEIRHVQLSSLESVRRFAEGIAPGEVCALFNNAGVISRSYSLTSEGLESTFSVNYFAPWLLTTLLADKLGDGARIVNMVSLTSRFVDFDLSDLRPREEDFRQLRTYARSKRALISFSQELSRRYPSLSVHLADPGIVASDMIDLGHWYDPIADAIFKPFCKSPRMGALPALNALRCAERQLCFAGRKSSPVPSRYVNPDLDLRLWSATEAIIKKT